MARTAAVYRKRVSSNADIWLFIVALGAGVVGLLILKFRNVDQIYVTLFPCTVMIGYAGVMLLTKRYQVREDQAGDNLYYLGFLFTLVSLAWSLARFASTEGRTDELVSNFGIALSTTILGLALRVLFNQMRRDPVEIERESRLELAQASSRLRAELDASVLEFNSFRRATQQAIAEGLEELGTKTEAALSLARARFEAMTSGIGEQIGKALEGFSENARKLNDTTLRTTSALERFIERIDAIEAPSDLMVAKLRPAMEGLTEMTRELRARTQAEAEQTRKLQSLVRAAVNAAGALDERVSAVMGAIQGVEMLSTSLGRAGDQATRLGEGFSAANASLEAESNRMMEVAKQFAAALEENRSGISWILKDGLDTYRSVLTELPTLAKEQLDTLRRHTQAIETELAKSREATGKTHAAISSMADLIVEKLG